MKKANKITANPVLKGFDETEVPIVEFNLDPTLEHLQPTIDHNE
jgi:hypothetical protein